MSSTALCITLRTPGAKKPLTALLERVSSWPETSDLRTAFENNIPLWLAKYDADAAQILDSLDEYSNVIDARGTRAAILVYQRHAIAIAVSEADLNLWNERERGVFESPAMREVLNIEAQPLAVSSLVPVFPGGGAIC